VRHLGSRIAIGMFDTIVHPGVYGTVGLPAWKTWKAVNRSAGRTALRHRALRPLLTPLLEAGVFRVAVSPRVGRPPLASTATAATSHRLRRRDAFGPPDKHRGPSKGDRTRQSLIDAAIVRFAREGYRGTSVADVCRDAGLSTTASYPYFANKEALFVAAVDEDVAGLIDDAVSLVGIESDQHWGHTMMRNLIERMDFHPLARRIVSGLEPDFTMRLLDIPALDQLRKGVTELMRPAADRQVEPAVRRSS
jgi:AcrR family transcriptional regulator